MTLTGPESFIFKRGKTNIRSETRRRANVGRDLQAVRKFKLICDFVWAGDIIFIFRGYFNRVTFVT